MQTHTNMKDLSRKEIKIFRKEIRRDTRPIVLEYKKKLMKNLDLFNDVIKKKPRFFPRLLWSIGLKLFIDMDKLQKLFEVNK